MTCTYYRHCSLASPNNLTCITEGTDYCGEYRERKRVEDTLKRREGELKKRIHLEAGNDVGPFEGGGKDDFIVSESDVWSVIEAAKADFPIKNQDPHADSFKVEEEFEDAVLDWFTRWFGEVEG